MDLFFCASTSELVKISKVETTAASSAFLSQKESDDECLGFLKLFGKQLKLFPSEYSSMQNILGITEKELLHAIPTETIKDHFQVITEAMQNVLCCKENEEYLVSYLEIKRFLRKLSPPIVDTAILQRIADNTEHHATKQRILDLKPGDNGRAKRTEYGMLGSRTGRLVVTSGPQILTLPSVSRKAFKSSFEKGSVLQIDLISAEPKIALHMVGNNNITDVYDHISNVILGGKVSRDQAKLITLCALYGQSEANLKKSLPDSISARSVIRETKQFFNVYELEKVLKTMQHAGGLRNVLGRPIALPNKDNRLLISYFLQSSAAEISILAFSEWCKQNSHQAIPLYVIHDAVIIDCNKELSGKLLEEKIITLKVGGWNFDAKVSSF